MGLFSSRHATVFRLMLTAALMIATWQALTPSPLPLPGAGSDKLAHAGTFLILALLADAAWPGCPIGWRALALLAAYGAGIEIVQHLVPNRYMSAADLIADLGGLALYVLLLGPWLRRLYRPANT